MYQQAIAVIPEYAEALGDVALPCVRKSAETEDCFRPGDELEFL